jgi:hypothetical protein
LLIQKIGIHYNAKEIDEEKFQELVNELDLERVMGESVMGGLATTQDEDVGESEREESAEEEPAAAEKAVVIDRRKGEAEGGAHKG